MHIIVLADEVGYKLWPVTSETTPKALLPVYSEASLLEETLSRMIPIAEGGQNVIIVTIDKAVETLLQQKTLEMYGIPKTNVITLPESKGSAWSMWEAIRYIIDKKGVSLDESLLVVPSDQFMWPKELAMFHFFNLAARIRSNPDEFNCICLTPGGPSPGMNYLYGDLQNVATMGIPYEDTLLGTVSTLHVEIDGYQIMPDLDSAKDLVANSWMWDLHSYGSTLGIFERYLKKLLNVSVSQIMKWDTLESLSFSNVIPDILEDRKLHGALIPKIAWSTLDNWVSIKHLLYDSGLFQPTGQAGVHSIGSSGNLVFKPPSKTIALYGVTDLIVIDVGDKLLIGTSEGLQEYF